MDKRLYPEYYLGDELPKDNSLFKIIAETLILAHKQGVDDALKCELTLLMAKYSDALRLMRHVQAKRSIYSTGAPNPHAREDAAAEFRQKCTLVDDVKDQFAGFVDYCADQIEGPF